MENIKDIFCKIDNIDYKRLENRPIMFIINGQYDSKEFSV